MLFSETKRNEQREERDARNRREKRKKAAGDPISSQFGLVFHREIEGYQAVGKFTQPVAILVCLN